MDYHVQGPDVLPLFLYLCGPKVGGKGYNTHSHGLTLRRRKAVDFRFHQIADL